MRLAWVLLLLVPLAGCLSDSSDRGDDDVAVPVPPPELVAPTFLPSLLLGQPEGWGIGGEPSVAVAPDGTIYVSAPLIPGQALVVGDGGQGRVWRSDDGGATFTLLNDADGRLTSSGGGNGDTDVAVDAAGRVHFVDLGGGIPYLWSDDGGATWEYEGELNEADRPVDRQWIDADGGVLAASWAAQDGNPRGITFTRSLDGGRSWSGPTDIVDGMIQLGPLEVAPGGEVLYQPYVTRDGYELHVLVSRDGGVRWNDTAVGHTLAIPAEFGLVSEGWSPTVIFPVVAADRAGNAYLVWSEYREDKTTQLAWSVSTDQGATWGPVEVLTDSANAIFPWVVAGDAGRVAVAYLASDLALEPNKGPHEWTLQVQTFLGADSANTAGGVLQRTQAQVAPEPVHVGAVCPHGGGCTTRFVPLYGDRTLLDFFEAAIAPDGDLVVVWTQTALEDGRNPQVRFARQDAGTPLLAALG